MARRLVLFTLAMAMLFTMWIVPVSAVEENITLPTGDGFSVTTNVVEEFKEGEEVRIRFTITDIREGLSLLEVSLHVAFNSDIFEPDVDSFTSSCNDLNANDFEVKWCLRTFVDGDSLEFSFIDDGDSWKGTCEDGALWVEMVFTAKTDSNSLTSSLLAYTTVASGIEAENFDNIYGNGIAVHTILPTPAPTLTPGEGVYGSFKYINYDNVYCEITGYTGNESEIIIPDYINNIPVTEIGDSAFYNYSGLLSIEIPEGVTRIGDHAFSGCSSLSSIKIPDGVTSICNGAFWLCTSLKSVRIPEGVTVIEDGVFGYCSNLVTIENAENIINIERNAFTNCMSLDNINIFKNATNIGESAFADCFAFSDIEIPEKVTSVGEYAFNGCNYITSVKIPEGMINIGEYAFSSCNNLETVYYYGTAEQWDSMNVGENNKEFIAAELVFVTKPPLNQTIKDNTYVSQYAEILGTAFECIVYKGENIVSDNSLLGTGMTIIITDKITLDTYTKEVVIYGDVNGDGKVAAADYMKIKKSIVTPELVTGVYFTAADLNKDGIIQASDYMKIKRYISGSYDIYGNMT